MTARSAFVFALSTAVLTAGCASSARPAVTAQIHNEPVLAASEASMPPRSNGVMPARPAPALRHYYLLSPGPNATLVVTRSE